MIEPIGSLEFCSDRGSEAALESDARVGRGEADGDTKDEVPFKSLNEELFI